MDTEEIPPFHRNRREVSFREMTLQVSTKEKPEAIEWVYLDGGSAPYSDEPMPKTSKKKDK